MSIRRDECSTSLDVTLGIETFLVVLSHMSTSVDPIGLSCLNSLRSDTMQWSMVPGYEKRPHDSIAPPRCFPIYLPAPDAALSS